LLHGRKPSVKPPLLQRDRRAKGHYVPPLAFTMMIHNYDAVIATSREPHTNGRGVRLLLDAKRDPGSSQDRTDERTRLPLPSL
jgi:hypothetical protein